MKLKVILFCVLLFSSKIVDSNPHSEGHHRQRVNPPSIWQGNQNAQDAQYLDTDFTQTRKVNTPTNSAIQQENIQDYNVNQGRHNYNDYGYNKNPASSSSGNERESYNLQSDGRRLESYPPRVETYPSEVGFDNQPLRKQNWRPQKLYTNSVPNAVLITDNERPLVNTVQEPYRAPVQYLQPKYIPSANRRFYQPDRSYQIREQLQYPLANNAGDSKYVANSGPRFESSGPVLYENYNEGQARASEVKAKLTDGQRYLQNLAPQSGNYNIIPVVIATDTLTQQSENIKYLENYRSRSDLSNTASSTNYEEDSPVVENYNLDSRLSNVPEFHESYNEGPTATSEIKTKLSDDRRYTQSFAPQSGIIYNESPAVIATDTLQDQFQNIKSENYRSRSDLSDTVSKTNYDDDSPVISAADNYNLHSRPINGPVSYERYSDGQATVSDLNPRPIEAQRYVQNFAPQSKIIYNDFPAGIATDVLVQSSPDQSSNIRYKKRENSKSRLDLSNIAPTTNYDADSSVISAAETHNEGFRPSNNPHDKYGNIQAVLSEERPKPISPQSKIRYNDAPAVTATDIIADQFNNIRYEEREEYKSRSDLSNIAPVNQDDGSPVIPTVDNTDLDSKPSYPAPENIEKRGPLEVNTILSDKPLARRYAHNYRSETGSSNIVHDNSFNGAPNVNSETVEEKSVAYEDNYGQNEPIPINTYSETSPTSTHTISTNQKINKIEESDVPLYGSGSPTPSNNPNMHHKMKELNLHKFNIQKLMDGSTKPYLVIHPNGTVEHLDTIDLDSQQISYFRLLNTKRINVGDMKDEETQFPELVPNNIAKTFVPQNETPLLADTQPEDYRESTPLNENQANSAYEFDSKVPNKALPADRSDSKPPNSEQKAYGFNLKPLNPIVNQPADNDNPKLPLFNQQEDGDKFKPLTPYIRHRTHHHKLKPTDVIQLPFDNRSNLSIPDENQLAVEKSKPNNSYLSSPDENPPSNVNTANLPLTENQSENDKNSESLSRPYKPHLHHRKSNLLILNQPTEDSILSPSSNENPPLDDNNYKPLPLNENQSIADIDSQNLHLHKRKPVHHYTSKHSHLNQPQDVNIVSSTSPSENKQADDNNSNSSSPGNNKSTENLSKLSNESQLEKNNKLKLIHTQYIHYNETKSKNDTNSLKNKPEDDKKFKPLSLDENRSANDDNFPKNKPEEDKKSKPLSSHKRQPELHNKSTLSHKGQSEIDQISHQNEDDYNSKSRSPGNNQSTDDDISENKPEDDKISKPSNTHQRKPTHHNKPKLLHEDQTENDEKFHKDIPEDDQNFKSSSPDDIESIDDDIFLESKSQNKNKIKPMHLRYRKPEHHNEPKPSYENQSEKDDTSPQNKPEDDINSNPSLPEDNELIDDDTLPDSQLRNKNNSNPVNPHKRHPGKHNKRNPTYGNQSEKNENSPKDELRDNNSPNASSLDNKSIGYNTYPENKPGYNTKSKPLKPHKRKSTSYNKSKLSHEGNSEDSPKDKPRNNNNFDSSFLDDDASLGDDIFLESQSRNNNKPKPVNPHKKQSETHDKRNFSYEKQPENYENLPNDKSKDNSDSSFLNENYSTDDEIFENKPEDDKSKPEYDQDFNSSSSDDDETIDEDTYLENQPRNNKKIKPKLPSHHNKPKLSQEDQSDYDDTFTENKSEEDVDSYPSPLDENQSEEDDPYSQNNPEDDINSVTSPAGENESEHSKKQTTVNKTDNQPVSSTLSTAAPNYTKTAKPQIVNKHKHRHISQKSTTNSPIVTTPCPNETSEDQIITLSPIEQVTDNVSDAPLVTTTTTTAKPPTKTPGKSDTTKDDNKQNNSMNSSSEDFAAITDKVRTSKAPTCSSTTQADSITDGKTTKGTVSNKNTQTNGNAVESQVNRKVQSAVYDSSELLDTNTDVLAEIDNNSPVTTSPSVQSYVNTGDASSANTLEFEQPETEIIITDSSSTNNGSEDDIITINVEVFEITGSSNNNQSLLVNIDTNNDSDDNTETSQPSDCDSEDNGKGKNLEIDLSNLQGEPTMWIRTTNQDFIDKLMNKNDTAFDMIYFYNIVTQPVIEREKLTTIHCNGTVVIETKEITYANKDDQTPTIVKTTETMQIEEYKRYGLDSLND